MSAVNNISLPEILLYGQFHDKYKNISFVETILDLTTLQQTQDFMNIFNSICPEHVTIFNTFFKKLSTEPKNITNFIKNIADAKESDFENLLKPEQTILISAISDMVIIKNDNKLIASNNLKTIELQFDSANKKKIKNFFLKHKLPSDLVPQIQSPLYFYKYIITEMCKIDEGLFNYALIYYQAIKDLENMKLCVPNGIVLEILLDRLRTIFIHYSGEVEENKKTSGIYYNKLYKSYNQNLQNLWLEVAKKYYSTKNLDIPETQTIESSSPLETSNLSFDYSYEVFSLDDEIKNINILSTQITSGNIEERCNKIVNLIENGSKLLLKFKENNVNYWSLLTRIAKLPIRLYQVLFETNDIKICLPSETLKKLAQNFGIWIEAISTSTLVHIYKYSYYLVLHKAFQLCDVIDVHIDQELENNMLKEFVMDCNRTQIFNTTILFDIDVIKNAIVKTKPIWFSETNHYKTLLQTLYNLVKKDNGIQIDKPIPSNILLKEMFTTSNIECYEEYMGTWTSLVSCTNDIVSRGNFASKFEERDPNTNEIILYRDVRFARTSIELNRNKIMTDDSCSAFYFPTLFAETYNSSTYFAILLQVICTCRLEKIEHNIYPRGLAGQCKLRPLKQDFDMDVEYLMYTTDIDVKQRVFVEYVDTHLNISGIPVISENDDSIYSFIKYLQTGDQEYLKYMCAFIKYGHSIASDGSEIKCEDILKYGKTQSIPLREDLAFSHNSICVTTDQIQNIYRLFEDSTTNKTGKHILVDIIKEKLKGGELDKLTYNVFVYISLSLLDDTDELINDITKSNLFTIDELISLVEHDKISKHNLLCSISNAIKYFIVSDNIEVAKQYFVYLNNIMDSSDKAHNTYEYSKPKLIKTNSVCDISERVTYLNYPLPEIQCFYDVNKPPSGGKKAVGKVNKGKLKASDKLIKPGRYRYGDLFKNAKISIGFTDLLKRLFAITNNIGENDFNTNGFAYGSIFIKPAWELLDMDLYDKVANSAQKSASENVDTEENFYSFNNEDEATEEATEELVGGGDKDDGKWFKQQVSNEPWKRSQNTNPGRGDQGRGDQGRGYQGRGYQGRGDQGRGDQGKGTQTPSNISKRDFFINNINVPEIAIPLLEGIRDDYDGQFKHMVTSFITDRKNKYNVVVSYDNASSKFLILIKFALSPPSPSTSTLVDSELTKYITLTDYLFSLKRKLEYMYKTYGLPLPPLISKPAVVVPNTTQDRKMSAQSAEEFLVFNEQICGLLRILDIKAYNKIEEDIKTSFATRNKGHPDDSLTILRKMKYLHSNYVLEKRSIINSLRASEYMPYLNTLIEIISKKLGSGELGWITLKSKETLQYYYPKSILTKPLKIHLNLDFTDEKQKEILTNYTSLKTLLESIPNGSEYITEYDRVTEILSLPNVVYNRHSFHGIHSHTLPIYENRYFSQKDMTHDIQLSSLFLMSIGLFLESRNKILDVYNIDGFYYDPDVKQYVKTCKNKTSSIKQILLTQTKVEDNSKVLIKIFELCKDVTPKSFKNSNNTIEIRATEIPLTVTNGNVTKNTTKTIIKSITINNKLFENLSNVDLGTSHKATEKMLNKYITGYINKDLNINVHIPLCTYNEHLINNYDWYNNIGTTTSFPYYELEYKNGYVYKHGTSEKFVNIVDILTLDKNQKFVGIIETLLHIAESSDDMFIWETDGVLTSIDFIKSQINFKLIDNTIVINDEYNVVDGNNWMLQRWSANIPNLLIVQDIKDKNYFIYVLPIGNTPHITDKEARLYNPCTYQGLDVITGKKPRIYEELRILETPQKSKVMPSKEEIKAIIKPNYLDIIANMEDLVKNVKGVNLSDTELIDLFDAVVDHYALNKAIKINNISDVNYISEIENYLYNEYNGKSMQLTSTNQNSKQAQTYLLKNDVMQNIFDRLENVKYANMFKENFDNIERYSDEIVKQHLSKKFPDAKDFTQETIDKYSKQIDEIVSYYKKLLVSTNYDSKLNAEQSELELSIYKYVKINFGLSISSEKIIKFNMVTLMPIINNKQVLEHLCMSYLNFDEIGNVFELSDIIRKMGLNLDKHILSSLMDFFDYKNMNDNTYIEYQRFRIPSFARVQSSLVKRIHNLEKSYNITYIYSDLDVNTYNSEQENIFIEYFFPSNQTYIMPTFAEHFVFLLLDKTRRDITFSLLLKKMEINSITYPNDIKKEFDEILQKIKTDGKYTTNPLEFFYQCIVGFLARPVQQIMANKIISDICEHRITSQTGGYKVFSRTLDNPDTIYTTKESKNGRIHTLIMGGGKTKMITPLVILKYLQQISLYYLKENLANSNSNYDEPGNHMYIILPENLVRQSYEHLVMLNMYFPVIVNVLDETRDSGENESIKFSESVEKKNNLELQLYIMSDTTMKCGILNDIDKKIQMNSSRHCYLFDEVDTVLDPIISELNYPNVATETKLKNTDKFYGIIYEILNDIYVKNTPEIIEMLKMHKLEYLTTPHFYLKEKGELGRKIQEYALSKCVEHYKSNLAISKGLTQTNIDKTYLDTLTEENISILMALHNFISEALPASLLLRNRHHYGLSTTIPRKQKVPLSIIVPFSYAEKPRDGSNFSNPILVMVLTTIDYLIQITPLSNIIINDMIILINNMLKNYPSGYKEQCDVYKEYTRLSISPENTTSIKDLSQSDIDKIRKSKLFIKLICQLKCSEQIVFSLKQANISGLDLVMSNNAKYRSGFTGTPNIPQFVDMYKNQSLNVVTEQDDAATRDTKQNIKTQILNSNVKFAEDTDNIQQYLKSILESNIDHSVLIDVGAVLVGTTPQIIFDIVKSTRPNLKHFIYWNNEDRPISKNEHGKELDWSNSIGDNMFYYYDNMHTTGIDARIATDAKGIVLLGSTSRFRDVAQGMYRMRKLHAGQSITFVVNKKIKNEISLEKLLEWFDNDESSYLNSQQKLMNGQNILALARYDIINIEPSYEIDNAFSYPQKGSLSDLKIITGEESLRHTHIVTSKKHIDTVLENNIDPNVNKEQIIGIELQKVEETGNISIAVQQTLEQVKEIAQTREIRRDKQKPDITGKKFLISNESIADYFDVTNITYYDIFFSDIIYISKNLKYYMLPFMTIYTNEHFFILPFIEGYKLLDTYIRSNESFPSDIVFVDSYGVNYNKNDTIIHIKLIEIQLVSLFISLKHDNTLYISAIDYLKIFSIVKTRGIYIKALLTLITNEDSTNELFALFSKAILIYNRNTEEINVMIDQFNGLTVDERRQYYSTIPPDYKPIFEFLTLDGKIIDNSIDF